jgi:hypothetical protein
MKKSKNLSKVSLLVFLTLILILGILFMFNLYESSSEENDITSENPSSIEQEILECVPETCSSFDTECGYISNGCGNQIFCGKCNSGYECIDNGCEKIVEDVEETKEGCVINGEETGNSCDYPSDCYELAFSMGEEDMRSVSCLGGNNEIDYGYELSRDIPDKAGLEENFSLVYSFSREGKWGASLIDSVSGGCKFSNGKKIIKTVILSQGGQTSQVYEITAPDYPTTCTFVGDYMFGSEDLKNIVDASIEIN